MKTAAILPCLLFSLSALAADAPRHSLSLSVRPLASGGATRTKKDLTVTRGETNSNNVETEKQDFSDVREKNSGLELEIELHNFRNQPDNAQLEWYFFARKVDSGDPYLIDSGNRSVAVGAAGVEKFTVESAEVQSSVERKLEVKVGSDHPERDRPKTSEKKSGEKRAGWIVRMLADGAVLEVRASTPSLETLGRDSKRLAASPRRGGSKKK